MQIAGIGITLVLIVGLLLYRYMPLPEDEQ